jgi:hypothetical protein
MGSNSSRRLGASNPGYFGLKTAQMFNLCLASIIGFSLEFASPVRAFRYASILDATPFFERH